VSERRWFRWVRRRGREGVRDNQWLLPLLGALLGLALAALVGTGGGTEQDPWTVTVERARDTLFGSLALVFTALSIVLALASVAAQNVVGRYGARVLRIYARHSADRWVIGVFALAATFILAEQFQLRRLDPDDPAPVAALVISIILLVITGSTVIWYIASLIRWFRTDRAVAGVVAETRRVARRLRHQRQGTTPCSLPERPEGAVDLLAYKSGHLAEVDTDTILEACGRLDASVVIMPFIGEPLVVGQPIGWLSTRDPKTELQPERVSGVIDISGTRELGQSLEYGLTALVDVAIIALSPAINDPNSAVEVIEEMSFLFAELADVRLGSYAVPGAESWPRVIVRARTFGEFVDVVTEQIVLYGVDDPNVHFALRRFARSLQLYELDEADRAHVDAFAAKLERPST